MGERLERQPGDIILISSIGGPRWLRTLRWAIRRTDNSPYTHSGFMTEADVLSHIDAGGSTLESLDTMVSRPGGYDLVSSYTAPELDDATRDRLVAIGSRMGAAGFEYSEIELGLAGMLLLHRKVPWSLRWICAPVIELFATAVNRHVDRNGDLYTCSDYVYQAFDQAGLELFPSGLLPEPSDPLTLDSAPGEVEEARTLTDWFADQPQLESASPQPTPFDDADASEFGAVLENEITAIAGPIGEDGSVAVDDLPDLDADTTDRLRSAVAMANDALARASGTDLAGAVDPNFVTPGDLARTNTTRLRAHLRL